MSFVSPSQLKEQIVEGKELAVVAVSYTHLRAHET